MEDFRYKPNIGGRETPRVPPLEAWEYHGRGRERNVGDRQVKGTRRT